MDDPGLFLMLHRLALRVVLRTHLYTTRIHAVVLKIAKDIGTIVRNVRCNHVILSSSAYGGAGMEQKTVIGL